MTEPTNDESCRRAREDYEAFKARGIELNMVFGWPCPEQLENVAPMLSLPGGDDYRASGRDCRNYGGIQGLEEIREIFSPILGIPADQLVAGNNSSLALMHDVVVYATMKGVPGGEGPWVSDEKRRFLCLVPGYYCHFDITETYGFELTAVPLTGQGPDMDVVEEAVKDPAVKGIWCVPQFSNPSGETYSDETVARLAEMKTGAPSFRILWDDAYAVHNLTPELRRVANILDACVAAGHPDRPILFSSTSKITFAGAGVAFLGASPENVAWYLKHAYLRMIGPDKINQLRHVRFLKSAENVKAIMEQHRLCLAPKFEAVDEVFHRHLDDEPGVSWTEPKGGYFTLLTVKPGTARRTIELAREAGLRLSPAGTLHPDRIDPDDKLIRIAPTYPSLEDVKLAAVGIALCARLAARESAG